MSAVEPSPERATLQPNQSPSKRPLPISFGPCCVQVAPDRVKTHAAPNSFASSYGPPPIAVFPSAESATLDPRPLPPLAPPGVSCPPCCVQLPPERVNTVSVPVPPLP